MVEFICTFLNVNTRAGIETLNFNTPYFNIQMKFVCGGVVGVVIFVKS